MEVWALVVGMALTIFLSVRSRRGPTGRGRRSARRHIGLLLPERACGLLDAVHVARDHVRAAGGPGYHPRSLVITAGIGLTALVGVTRAYLRVHWLSDVTSGWALGLSCFSAVAAMVLVTSHIRHNPRRHDRADQRDPGAATGVGN